MAMRRGGMDLPEGLRSHVTCGEVAEFLDLIYPYFVPPTVCLRVQAWSCFLLIAFSKGASVLSPIMLSMAVDEMTNGVFAWDKLVIFAMLRMASKVLDEIQRCLYIPVQVAGFTTLSERSMRHVLGLSMGWHMNKPTGGVIRSLDRGIGSADTVVTMLFLRLVPTFAELIAAAAICIAAFDAPWPALAIVVGFVIYVVATFLFTDYRRKVRSHANTLSNRATQFATEALLNAETVKSYAAEEIELRRYTEAVSSYQRSMRVTQLSLAGLNSTQQVIIALTIMSVLLITGIDAANGTITIGTFVALYTYTVQTFAPLSWLGTLYSVMVNAFVDLNNLSNLLRVDADVVDSPDAKPLSIKWAPPRLVHPSEREGGSGTGDAKDAPAAAAVGDVAVTVAGDAAAGPLGASIEFEDVWFKYQSRRGRVVSMASGKAGEAAVAAAAGASAGGHHHHHHHHHHGAAAASAAGAGAEGAEGAGEDGDAEEGGKGEREWAIAGLSVKVQPGKTLALVGHTGCGKTTVTRLLLRYWDVEKGRVKVNGRDIRDYKVRSLRTAIGVVPQDISLFNETIRYNIAYGKPGATQREVEAAAAAAELHDFIMGLEDGYDTMVGERGLRLSGGERQRLAIARVLLKNPAILLLDEYTAALDAVTEASVHRTIAAAATGRTVIVIAHRLSTARSADEILVLKEGRVVEAGSHDDLLARGGKYAEMWEIQARERQDGGSDSPPPSE